ncbi:MAG: aminotransferase class V-fold PLP-dependent enzyme [Planctomycetes bacterium]|nr:aminotransferase class V-fold PLP-dependent enzyme [Planctomycetota bacterium]
MRDDPLLSWRKEFPILETTNYLISHSLGAMPRKVRDRLAEYADLWATRGIRAWAEGWWTSPVDVGNVLAGILDADPGSVVMHQNVSVIEGLIASCLDYTPERNRVVYTELNFPTVMYVWEAQRRRGAEIVTVASPDGMTVPTEAVIAAIDERTLVVPISHVLFKSSYRQDAQAIIARAHEVGAMVILDCYQSTGTVPFSVKELDVDFVCGGSVKWLCGGPGAGYLYVRADHRAQLEPALTGWMAHEKPFDFVPGAIRYAPGIERFLHGSPAVPALYAARSGYEIVAEIGVQAIRAKSVRQTELLRQAAGERGFRVASPEDPDLRGGTIVIDVQPGPAIVAELAAREILVDYRPEAGIRVSPHFYTRDEDLIAFLDEVRSILDTRAYEKHVAKGAAY